MWAGRTIFRYGLLCKNFNVLQDCVRRYAEIFFYGGLLRSIITTVTMSWFSCILMSDNILYKAVQCTTIASEAYR